MIISSAASTTPTTRNGAEVHRCGAEVHRFGAEVH
jgi:hypothetical protein